MALPTYKYGHMVNKSSPHVPRPKIETRIIKGKSARVEILHNKIIRVYDDNNNIVEDRTASLGIDHPPLLKPKPEVKFEQVHVEAQEVGNIEPNRNETEAAPILKIPSFATTDISNEIGTIQTGTATTDLSTEIDMAKDISTDSNQTPSDSSIPTEQKIESPIQDDTKNTTSEIDKTSKDIGIAPEVPPNIPENPTNISDVSSKDTAQTLKEPAKDAPKNIPDNKQPALISGSKSFSQKMKPIFEKLKTAETVDEKLKTDKNIDSEKKGVNSDKDLKINNQINIDANPPNKPTTDNKLIVNETHPEHGNINKAKNNEIEEDKNMVEEVLEEYKRNKWAEDRDYKKNIEDMARTSIDNKEKIADISDKITNVEGKLTELSENRDKIVSVDEKVGNLQDNLKEKFGVLQNLQEHLQEHLNKQLGEVKRPVAETLGELCTGIDCIKEDLKKSQESVPELEKKMDSRFTEIRDRIQKLEIPTYVCDNCGYDELRPLSSFCPNCGTPIYGWSDPETGNPVAGWSPYWKRGQRAKSPE